ncbi:MAG: peptide deformylase [Myxococcales bacterium]|nr:peptide deformylase [Myxococcales bacterium]
MTSPQTKRKILTYPNPYLREEAQTILEFDNELKALFEEMCVLMHESDGVGLAATQVGESIQLLVLSSYVFLSDEERKRFSESEEGDMGKDLAIINPQVLEQSEDELVDHEGCLSFPDVYIKVKRPKWVKIVAQDIHGERIELRGEGFGARAILHEMDHLNGKVMTDHLSFLAKQKALKDHQRIQKRVAKNKAEETSSKVVSKSKSPGMQSKMKHKTQQRKKRGSKKKR